MRFIRRTEVIVLSICVVITALLYAANIAGAEGFSSGVNGTVNTTAGNAFGTTNAGVQSIAQTTVIQVLPAVVITATPDLCDSGAINLAWNAVPSADGYRLYRDSTSNQIYEGTELTHADTHLANGSNHMYYLQAFKAGFTSSNTSLQITAPIACPTVIEPYGGDNTGGSGASGVTNGANGTGAGQSIPVARNLAAILDTTVEKGVVLTWSSDSGATSFAVFRRVLGKDFVVIGTVAASAHRFVDHELVPGTQYEYEVRMCTPAGCSTPSNVVGVSTPAVVTHALSTATSTTGGSAANTTTTTVLPQTNITPLKPVAPAATTVVKPVTPIVPETALVPKSAPEQTVRPVTVQPVQTAPAWNTTNVRFEEPRTVAPSAASPSQVVLSMQAIAETVSISQSTVNAARDSLIAAIDSHIDTVRRIASPEEFATQENAIRAIREALVADIDTTLGRGTGVSAKDEARLQKAIQDGFGIIDRAASLDSSVPDATRQLVANSMGSLVTASQDAAKSLAASGGADLYKDTNRDGISDYDSVRIYNLDPIKPSPVTIVDGRTLNAGDKVLLGYDPTANVLMAVPREEPELSLAPETTVYAVDEVKLTTEKRVAISGRALPNSYVTLYIYSTPIVVTVKTDSSGKWKYTVDRELETGEHKIYAASVDNTGRIVAKTVAIPFTKTAEAATLDTVPSFGAATVEKPSLTNNRAVLPLIAFSILFIIGALYVIGKDRTPKNPTPSAA